MSQVHRLDIPQVASSSTSAAADERVHDAMKGQSQPKAYQPARAGLGCWDSLWDHDSRRPSGGSLSGTTGGIQQSIHHLNFMQILQLLPRGVGLVFLNIQPDC